MPPWNAARTKVQLRIAVQRLRMLQEKKGAQAKASRRDIATLLETQKIEKARVKVETIINEDIHIELLELLELYCELLIARFGYMELTAATPDPGISEGVCSIIYAAPRTDLKELHILRDLLMHKYGREFSLAVMENRDNCVGDRVMKKLAFQQPDSKLVDAYLAEIAKGYGVAWSPPVDDSNELSNRDGDADSTVSADLESLHLVEAKFPDPKEPVLPNIPPTEDDDDATKALDKLEKAKAPAQTKPPPPEDPLTALQRRFDDLKKR